MITKEVIIIFSCVLGLFLFSAFIYKQWEKVYENKKDKEKERETEFDFDRFNDENFGI